MEGYMGTTVQLTTVDGNSLNAYKAEPDGSTKGAVVVIQEIFGVNDHIRNVTDGYAEQGYLAIAPALFDRVRPGIELEYDQDGIDVGRKIAFEDVTMDQVIADVEAACDAVSAAGKVGIVRSVTSPQRVYLTKSRPHRGTTEGRSSLT